jgi:hypothetical protein
MQRARALENTRQSVPDRGAESSAPRSTPLTLVAGAVAGDDLESVAISVAGALGCAVTIAIPALGQPVVSPPASLTGEGAAAIAAHALAIGVGNGATAPDLIVEAVPVRIGEQIVGIVAALAGEPSTGDRRDGASDAARSGAVVSGGEVPGPERHAWLEAAAAAASVTALIQETHTGGANGSAEVLLTELAAGPPADLAGWLTRARRLGIDLSGGAVAISARADGTSQSLPEGTAATALVAALRPGRVLAVAPLGVAGGIDPAEQVIAALRAAGLSVGVAAPRGDLTLLHEAVREAELVAELGGTPDAQPAGQDDTYRLLIGVLLRDRPELEQLRDRTVTPLADYDARHDTELLDTLRAFLAHDGSTTETADAMKLHRHTVGYRLSRVHEVSGLSPYESDGRERLSLGIKANQILDAERRLQEASVNR